MPSSSSRVSARVLREVWRLRSSVSTSWNSEGAPALPEVKAHPIFQANELSIMMSPTDSGKAIVAGSGAPFQGLSSAPRSLRRQSGRVTGRIRPTRHRDDVRIWMDTALPAPYRYLEADWDMTVHLRQENNSFDRHYRPPCDDEFAGTWRFTASLLVLPSQISSYRLGSTLIYHQGCSMLYQWSS